MTEPYGSDQSIIMRQVVPSGPDGPLYYDAFRAVANLRGTPIFWGDVVLKVPCGILTRAQEQAIHRPFVRVARRSFGALIDSLDALRPIEGLWPSPEWALGALAYYLCRGESASGPDETSPILVIRPPLVAPVSQPVVADTDQSAIDSLIIDLGCRPPQG